MTDPGHESSRYEPEPVASGWQAEPLDPDTAVGPWPPPIPGPRRRQGEILAVIAVGGAIGACARYGATVLWPVSPGTFPWTTFWINVLGCAALGLLMVLVTERAAPHPLVRPFLGTGVLGGFTTFSTYTVDAQQLLIHGHVGTALLYLAVTLAAGGVAVWAAAALARRLAPPSPRLWRKHP